MSYRTDATGGEARRRIVCPPDSTNADAASLSVATMEVAGNVARTHTALKAVAGGATLALVAAFVGLGALGRYHYLLNYWVYRGFAPRRTRRSRHPALPIAAGTTIFHEGVPAGFEGVIRVVAFATVVLGAAALARPDSDTPPDGEREVVWHMEMETNGRDAVRRLDRVLG